MLGYRRKSFKRAHAALREVAKSPTDALRVLACQRILLEEIVRAEGRIRQLKIELRHCRVELKNGRSGRAHSQKLKTRIRWLNTRIDACQHLNYVWRCLGDGIAFSGLDKYAIKQTFYQTGSYDVKQPSGFLSGKAGLANELRCVEEVTSRGFPCIQTDLTNSVRHGDVCILTGGDPYLLEVKTSERQNERGMRQIDEITKLHSFFESDVATNLRGAPEIRRVASIVQERSYTDEMNACIEQAEGSGLCVVSPECGLYYVAIYGSTISLDEVFSKMDLGRPQVFLLNTFKTERAWAPYQPFTLSIYQEHHLYDFIKGELVLIVVLNVDDFCRQFAKYGIVATFEFGDTYPLTLTSSTTGFSPKVSEHYLSRIGLEFVAPSWIVEDQAHHSRNDQQLASLRQKDELGN
jgi:hypothetical protein